MNIDAILILLIFVMLWICRFLYISKNEQIWGEKSRAKVNVYTAKILFLGIHINLKAFPTTFYYYSICEQSFSLFTGSQSILFLVFTSAFINTDELL